jgi:glycosyltransferase involved in cell wall biosynthesis
MTDSVIDIIMPVYNGAAFISEAITSIQAQTFGKTRTIVVDDGSTDDSARIVAEFAAKDERILLIKQPHLGIQFALNAGLNEAKADYVAFLDADDLWHPEKLEKQLNSISEGNFEFCICLVQEFQDANTINQATKQRARTAPMKGYTKLALLARREVFSKYGMFDNSIGIGDFVEWFSRVLRTGEPVKIIDEVLAYRRIHNTNTMLKADKSSFLRILKNHLDESRKTNKG